MSSTNQKPEVKKSEFIKLVETNTKAQVAAHYGLTEKDVTKIAGQLKVKFSKRKEDNFTIVDDTEVEPVKAEEPVKTDNLVDFFVKASIDNSMDLVKEVPSNITNTEVEVTF